MKKLMYTGVVAAFALAHASIGLATAQQRVPLDPSGDLAEFTEYAEAMCKEGVYTEWGYTTQQECMTDIMAQAPTEGQPYSRITLPGGKTCFYPGGGASRITNNGC